MRTLYYESDLAEINDSIRDYIDQNENAEQNEQYCAELAKVENDFCALVESGVFHDAMGKTLNVFENYGQLCAEVETEY